MVQRSEPDVVTNSRDPQALQDLDKRITGGEENHAADLIQTVLRRHQAEFMIRLTHNDLCVSWLSLQCLSLRLIDTAAPAAARIKRFTSGFTNGVIRLHHRLFASCMAYRFEPDKRL
jgi:hypothetical protein